MRITLLLTLTACGPALTDDDTGDSSTMTLTSSGTGGAVAGASIRIVTWNVEGLSPTSTDEHAATRDILARLDADIVGLNEIDEFQLDELQALAADLGYPTVVVPQTNPFGELRNAMLARVRVTAAQVLTSAQLSGDPSANDMTRVPVAVTVDGWDLSVVCQHWKAGFDDADEFRRTVESVRGAQAGPYLNATHQILMGDVNAEVTDGAEFPNPFTSLPVGLPSSFDLGEDLAADLSAGIAIAPFQVMAAAGLEVIEASQVDGRLETRDVSGRRIDYILADAQTRDWVDAAEVYDTRDEHLSGGVPKTGNAPDREASATASDHFPVLVDLTRPTP